MPTGISFSTRFSIYRKEENDDIAAKGSRTNKSYKIALRVASDSHRAMEQNRRRSLSSGEDFATERDVKMT